jgi:uncharacterized membrane protein
MAVVDVPRRPERAPAPPVPRVVALDRLRAAALLLMLLQHLVKWLHGDARQVLPGWEGFAFTDVCAPAFTIAAGASGVLLAEALARKRRRRVDATVVRRYGLLVPLGIALQWVLWRAPWGWGVLETLGVGVVLSTLLARRLPVVAIALAAGAALWAGPGVVQSVAGRGGAVEDVFGADFPLVVYLGFALLGAAGARLLLDGRDRAGEALLLGGLLTLFVAVATAAGHPPDRYPATVVGFILPGVAGTLLLYGALARWSPPRPVEALLDRGARHTLGIFVGHYAIYWCLRSLGVLHTVAPLPAVGLALVGTVLVTTVAPIVPTLPWSPRTGRRQAPKTSASTSGTGRSSCS